jgi:hypothetical protein
VLPASATMQTMMAAITVSLMTTIIAAYSAQPRSGWRRWHRNAALSDPGGHPCLGLSAYGPHYNRWRTLKEFAQGARR